MLDAPELPPPLDPLGRVPPGPVPPGPVPPGPVPPGPVPPGPVPPDPVPPPPELPPPDEPALDPPLETESVAELDAALLPLDGELPALDEPPLLTLSVDAGPEDPDDPSVLCEDSVATDDALLAELTPEPGGCCWVAQTGM